MSTISMKPAARKQEIPWSFLYSLRESQLLTDDQLDQLQQLMGHLDMAALAVLVLEKGWLTAYQWKRIQDRQPRGLILGQYRILDQLGEGGFGTVYKAVHSMMNRVAAIKVIAQKWLHEPQSRDLFLREVVATTRLTHPNIALGYEASQTDGVLWFAMEFVDGPNLEHFVATQGPLSVTLACAVMHQVARALQYAHENGMVHRDIKPANLLLPGAGSPSNPPVFRFGQSPVLVKVVDFGLARLFPLETGQFTSICKDGVCIGTPDFMSPEQARNSHQVDIRADLYSLGCTFYYALTGKAPFEAATELETITLHLEKEPVPIRNLRPEIPTDIADIIHKLMAKKPEQRYETPADLLEALNFTLGNPYRRVSVAPNNSEGPSQSSMSLEESSQSNSAPRPQPSPIRGPKGAMDTTKTVSIPATKSDPASSTTPNLIDTVPELWQEWFAIIDNRAQGTLCQWSQQEYAVLYETLQHGLKRPPVDTPLARRELYARLAALVEPWVTLRALADLDRKTLLSLWQICKELTAEVSPPARVGLGTWIFFITLLAGSVLLASYFLFSRR